MKFAPFVLLAACVSQAAPKDLPPGFVPVDKAGYEWRLMSAQGVVVGLQTRPREPAGTLDFWSTVVQKEMEARNGYALHSSENVAAGRAMLFTAEATAYYLVLFLTDGRITTFEAGGPKKELEKELPALKAFAAKLQPS